MSANQPTNVLGGVVGISPTSRRPAYRQKQPGYNASKGLCMREHACVCLFDNTIRRYSHPMGRRALHGRPWEYHQMVDTTHGDFSSRRSAMGVGFVCKIAQGATKQRRRPTMSVIHGLGDYLDHGQPLRLPGHPCSRPEPQAWTAAKASSSHMVKDTS